MPPVKKTKKQAKPIAPPVETPTTETEEQLAISGQLDKKMKRTKARKDRQRGVVVIRHLPHGFFEEQLKNYFQQFGNVTRLRLARSRRTGGSKGFAYVEFEYPEVAKVAAETMDNYLMFQKVVKAAYIPPEGQQHNYFRSSVRKVFNKVGKPIYVSGRTAAIQKKVVEHNNWSDEAYQKRIRLNLRKLEKLKEKYAHLGIDFENFTVQPNIQTVNEKEEQEKKKKAEEEISSEKNKPEPGSILLLKKRKQPVVEKAEKKTNKKSKTPKVEKKIELKDLLENTLNDEDSSEDEEFVPTLADDFDEDITTSDEEDYGLEDKSDDDDDDDDEEEEEPPQLKKVAKHTKVDRMAELIKRKPHAGGIQKANKNPKAKSIKPSSAMNTLKVSAAKEIKQLGKMKQLKKTDFNKSNKKKRA